jgi:hypothetical protein
MRAIKIFISGRVIGLPREEAVRNFERGEKLLLQNTYDFINPLKVVPEEATPAEAMEICLPLVCSNQCDGILLRNDSMFSEGSLLEKATAQYCHKLIFEEDDLN